MQKVNRLVYFWLYFFTYFYTNLHIVKDFMKSAKLENRVLFYSPSVQAGWEKESHRLDFDFISELGKGSFGVVYKVMHKKTKRVYAIK